MLAGEIIEEGDGHFDSWPFQMPERWLERSSGYSGENSSMRKWGYPRGSLIACPVCLQLDVPKSGVFNAHNIPPIADALKAWHLRACEGRCPPPPATDLYCFTCHVMFDQTFVHEADNLIELYNAIPLPAVDASKPRVCAQFQAIEPTVTRFDCGSLTGDGYAYGQDHDVLLALHTPSIMPASQFASMGHIGRHRSLLYETYHRRQSNGYLSIRP